MNWDQIETKWMAMARRVRPDWTASAITRDTSRPQNSSDVVGSANGLMATTAQDISAAPVRFE